MERPAVLDSRLARRVARFQGDAARMTRSAVAVMSCLTFALLNASPSFARDEGADGRFNQRVSSHFTLLQDVDIDRYSGPRGSREFEVRVLEILEEAYDAVGDDLSLRPRRKIAVFVNSSAVRPVNGSTS